MTLAMNRRSLLAGLAGTGLVGVGPAWAARKTPQGFLVRTRDGLTLTGETQGSPDAPEILFVHGLRASRTIWDRQFADPTLARFRLVRFDLRGHGDSSKPEDPTAYADLRRWGDDIASVIAAAGLRRPTLVGWSLAGMVIGRYLTDHGGAALAAINLVGAVTKLSPELLTPASIAFAQTTASEDLRVRAAATARFLRACFAKPPSPVLLDRLLVENGMPPRAVAQGLGQLANSDVDAGYRGFRAPMLVTHGGQDALVRVAMSERTRSIAPDARLSLYPGAGHAAFVEEPARFDRELVALVARTAGTGQFGAINKSASRRGLLE